jgi:lysophospholipase L1-like esterase
MVGAAFGQQTDAQPVLPAPAVHLRWLGLTTGEVEMCGLPWFAENAGDLVRLPTRLKSSFRPAVWSLAHSPSGARIRFRSDTSVLSLRLEYPSPPNMANMHAYGQTGVDTYVDGSYLVTAVADKDANPRKAYETVLFDFSKQPHVLRDITLYLPLYKSVKVLGIGVEPGAKVTAPRPFAVPKPVVFYGTSITQGGCASRPGMSYEAILGRKLNIDFVNLGFSGNGLGEPELAGAVSEIDASCYVLDFGANHKTGEEMRAVYAPFLDAVRAKHPTTPIVVMTPLYTARELRLPSLGADWQQRRDHIGQVVQVRISRGDSNLFLVDGARLLGTNPGDGLVDGGHPNDLGFYRIAEGLAPVLRSALKLPDQTAAADQDNVNPKPPIGSQPCLRVVSREVFTNQTPFLGALYAEPKGLRLISASAASDDNGQAWTPQAFRPDLKDSLPYGYRRDPVTSVCDRRTGQLLTILNALDTPGLDPKLVEPAVAQNTYYLRYRVSRDGGRSWLLDEPIVQTGPYDSKHPIEGVWIGKNAIYLGDAGCIPIVTRKGKVLVPAQLTPLAPDGTLYNPSDGHTFTEVVVLIGTWAKGGRLKWECSQHVCGDPARSTRGLIEPTLAELPDGRILMVMRGSNGGKDDPKQQLPSYKWSSVSKEGGRTWSKAEPWAYNDGRPFFSPSSMSTLFKHSTGRFFWVGNILATNCAGNLPRWPLVAGEVDPKSLRLIRQSQLVVDTEQPSDKPQGRLDISHVTLFEDRQTYEIVLTYPRAHRGYKSYEWVTARLALNPCRR